MLLLLPGCGVLPQGRQAACGCCAPVYQSIESAQRCLEPPPGPGRAADSRLLLLAFLGPDQPATPPADWRILGSPALVAYAQKRYLLVTLPANARLRYPGAPVPELEEVRQRYPGQTFFVLVNQALYPFADWPATADESFIRSRLSNGNGP
ncbi:hypothetical protein [Hymenobacter chitinivorans]|uniref:Uncharacterized protein n=1 Tax=Hymenobacter chitinivorans DSM 11115 TaxID=1121954 RepID=A0A2M9BSF8_9BACT|nr:hypothetical protein [Hymenobacter chitinivorans]PJJ60890.1 hypothetical protein CLV45_2325 [Hymenobacter chitinivorans DSM 11115]